MVKKKAIFLNMTVFKIVGILISLLLLVVLSEIFSGNLLADYDKVTEAKAIEIRNTLLYLNTVEEGIRVVSVDKDFKVILEKQNITVEYDKKGIKHTLLLAPINKNIIEPASIEDVSICISKKIYNCHNNITICKEGEDCCKFEPLTDTLCTSSNH